jgi:hypothetical protein
MYNSSNLFLQFAFIYWVLTLTQTILAYLTCGHRLVKIYLIDIGYMASNLGMVNWGVNDTGVF